MGINLEKFIERLYNYERLSEKEIKELCENAIQYYSKVNNIVEVHKPITVVGDIHGQFFDLMEIFSIGGKVPDTNYLFLGDYVDRGFYSIETFTLLLCLKIKYKERIHLLRGNHESREITQIYGFYDECFRKYGNDKVWKYVTDVFDYLPLCSVIDKEIFCVHGGLSPSIKTLSDIEKIDRKKNIPLKGPLCDLVWSDPNDDIKGFGTSPRETGWNFGKNETKKFLNTNKFSYITRAHQIMNDGYFWFHDGGCLSLFSAPNYVGRCENKGAIMEVDDFFDSHFAQYNPHPDSDFEKSKISTEKIPDFLISNTKNIWSSLKTKEDE